MNDICTSDKSAITPQIIITKKFYIFEKSCQSFIRWNTKKNKVYILPSLFFFLGEFIYSLVVPKLFFMNELYLNYVTFFFMKT